MNKQELIDKLASLVGLDEPQKPVVPKFVAEWISKCRELNWTLLDLLAPEAFESSFARNTEEWLRQDKQNYDILARAWLDGYEVEKEPLYYVIFPLNRWDEESGVMETHLQYLALDITSDETRFFSMPREDVGSYRTKLTKIQIESVDERFLAFTVPVEEVVEG